jgi:hypothetical protein
MFFCYLSVLLFAFGSLLAKPKWCLTNQRLDEEPALRETESRDLRFQYEAGPSHAVCAIISDRRAIHHVD